MLCNNVQLEIIHVVEALTMPQQDIENHIMLLVGLRRKVPHVRLLFSSGSS
jgi:hypothetical protein